MIDVKKAVKIARDFTTEIYEDEEVANISLEEVNFDDTTQQWAVTIGFDTNRKKISRPNKPLSIIGNLNNEISEEAIRAYKVVHLDAEDGEFKGMTMRQVG
ncbi:MAG: hypothetical protein KGV51_05355 [Moraxellaceae bacterium]|nr:hypothetical protein [Moraxellaceae bacterium]